LAGVINVAVTSGARHISHTYGLAVSFALATNLTQYVYWKAQTRRGSHWNRYGPTYLLALSIPLTTIDYIRHTILDNHFAIGKHLSMYKHGCSDGVGLPNFECLSTVGWITTVVCTYTGYICMIVGMLWAVDIKRKVIAAFREIRKAQSIRSHNPSRQPLIDESV